MIQPTPTSPDYVEEVQVEGHIIDSLLLPKILDEILTRGGTYVIKDIQIGQRQADPSHARIEVRAPAAREAARDARRHPRPWRRAGGGPGLHPGRRPT